MLHGMTRRHVASRIRSQIPRAGLDVAYGVSETLADGVGGRQAGEFERLDFRGAVASGHEPESAFSRLQEGDAAFAKAI